jgi:hypothetical protein
MISSKRWWSTEHDGAEHLDEAAVAVPGEARVAEACQAPTVASFRPRFSTVSIMPGMETRAPGADGDRAAGLCGVAEAVPDACSMRRGAPATLVAQVVSGKSSRGR